MDSQDVKEAPAASKVGGEEEPYCEADNQLGNGERRGALKDIPKVEGSKEEGRGEGAKGQVAARSLRHEIKDGESKNDLFPCGGPNDGRRIEAP